MQKGWPIAGGRKLLIISVGGGGCCVGNLSFGDLWGDKLIMVNSFAWQSEQTSIR